MRIIAGKFKGLSLAEPKAHKTHPMSEKIRGALFNALGDISGLNFLDAFGGSGAVAIEAVSRGAENALVLESDIQAFKAIKLNMAAAKTSYITAININTSVWLEKNQDQKFNIVVADPPYDQVPVGILTKLADRINPGGIYILSLPVDYTNIEFVELTKLQSKVYGNARLDFYRKK